MYILYLAIQITSFVMSLVVMVIVALKKPSRVQSACLLLVSALFLMSMAYLIELTTTDREVMMAMCKFEYVSLSVVSVAMLWFNVEFCKLKTPAWLYNVEALIGIIVVVGVMTNEYHGLVYSAISVFDNGYFIQCDLTPGPIYILLYANLSAIFVYSIISCHIRARESAGLDRKRAQVVILGLTIPLVSVIVNLSGLSKGFDTIPFGLLGAMLCYFFAFVRYGYFNSVQAATDNFINFATEGLLILSAKRYVQLINPPAQKLFPKLKKGESVLDTPEIEDILLGKIQTISANGMIYDIRCEPILEMGHVQGYMLWFVDMTEHYSYLKEMEALTRRAEAANIAKSDFLASMSHEIRTPMNAVLGMNEMIQRESTESNVREYAYSIDRAGRTLLSIINDILDISKIENGKTELVPVEYSLSSLLNDLCNMSKAKAEEKRLEFYVNVAEDCPDKLIGDEVRVRQAMLNIVNNALKYTQEGFVAVNVTWEHCGQGNEILLHFSVKDSGIGIREEDKDKLFKSFVRVDEIKNRSIEGTGLGLAITGRLVDMMNGRLGVESEYGKGSNFFFYIHQKVQDYTPIGAFSLKLRHIQSEVSDTPAFVAPQAQVLMVDDSNMNLSVLKALLRRTKVQTTAALSGEECIALMEQNRYDLVLLDHMMPGMDGVETLKELKRRDLVRKTPIVALTANAIVGAREQYMRDGFDDYISKPIETDKLEAVIKRLLSPELVQIPGEEKQLPTVLAVVDDAPSLVNMQKELRGLCKLVPVRTSAQAAAYLAKSMPKVMLCELSQLAAVRQTLTGKELPETQIAITAPGETSPSGQPSIELPLTAEKLKEILPKT